MDYKNLVKRRDYSYKKMQEAYSQYLKWFNAYNESNAILSQPFLQVNPQTQINPYVQVKPYTEVSPHTEVKPYTHVNPKLNSNVEVKPQTQVNPKLNSNVEVNPDTQAYFNFDPDFNLNIGKW